MKKIVLMAMALLVITVSSAHADKLIVTKVDQVTVKLDKNGNEYTKFLITEDRELDGIKYKATTNIMCFQPLSNEVKQTKAGSTIRLIVKPQTYQGNQSYTGIALIK